MNLTERRAGEPGFVELRFPYLTHVTRIFVVDRSYLSPLKTAAETASSASEVITSPFGYQLLHFI